MKIKFSAARFDVARPRRHSDALNVSLRATADRPRYLIIYALPRPPPRTRRPTPIREDVWRSINLSARECKEDWFPAGTGAEKRVELNLGRNLQGEVVFVIFLPSCADY